MTGGLVDVVVDRYHKVQRGQCLFQSLAIGSRQHGIAAYRHQPAYLACTRCQHFFRHGRDWQFSIELGELPYAAEPSGLMFGLFATSGQFDCRLRKHHAARCIKMPADDIDRIDQPVTQTTVLLRGYPHPPIQYRARLICVLLHQRGNRFSGNTCTSRGDSWRVGRRQLLQS